MPSPSTFPSAPLLEKVRAHYDGMAPSNSWAARGYSRWLARYYNRIIPEDASVLEVGCGAGGLLSGLKARRVTGVDLSERQLEAARKAVPHGRFFRQSGELLELDERFDVIIISETLNLAVDVQALLERLHRVAGPRTRLVMNFPSALWRPAFGLATALGLRPRHPRSSWLSTHDVSNLLSLSGWEVVWTQSRILVPFGLLGVDTLANRWLAPLVPWLCLCVFCSARPGRRPPEAGARPPKVSVVIPARNEAGNIAEAVRRTPQMGGGTELIFVEGHSRDDTWERIRQAQRDLPEREIKILQQGGSGKGDAVRAGFAAATGDILMILDADLTMPPEELPKFYEVLASGRAEFGNGVRLVYPMEREAMRFLNLCANKAFGVAFSWLLGQPVKDTLCGTKVLWRADYERIAANRAFFGEFDPFGDFDLLFGAAKLSLKIADIPIRYRERTYGSTNIQRWRHGWLLLRMVGFAARKLKFV